MITVHLRYEIDPDKLEEFTQYGREWIRLVNRLGGTHHGYERRFQTPVFS